MSAPLKLYLFGYNSLQATGWAVALFRILITFASTSSVASTYVAAGNLIRLLQTVAFIEVLNGALGIVPSGALFPLMQWGGRIHFLLAIIRQISEVQELPSVFITFVTWSFSDVIRYLHYALNSLGSCPSWLTYIRYTAFIVLYPVGMALGEMLVMIRALPIVKKTNLYADFFSGLPFNYYDFLRVLLVVYPFLWLKLYLHLFKQRQSKLGKSSHDKKKE